MAVKIGKYTSDYIEDRFIPEEQNQELQDRIAKRFEKILKKINNYSKYFFSVLLGEMLESDIDENVYYGLFLSRMRKEINLNMQAAAGVGFDLLTKVKIIKDNSNLTEEEKELLKRGIMEKTENAEEYFLTINPLKMALFTRDERIAVIKHEIHHMLRMHHLRMFEDKIKSKEQMEMENIALDMEINGTFDNPYIRNLSGTKGHVPHPYPAIVKEVYFMKAYENGLISEKDFERILTEHVSAEEMLERLLSFKAQMPELFQNMNNCKMPGMQDQNQQGQQQSQGQSQEQKSGGGYTLPGEEDDLSDDNIPDDNLSPEEMKKRTKEMKKQIKELDELLNKGKNGNQQEQDKDSQNRGQQEQKGQQGQGLSSDKKTQQEGQQQGGLQGEGQEQKKESRQQQNADNGLKEGNNIDEIKKEYDKTVNELAKKMAEAYMKGVLRGDMDSHKDFVRNMQKGQKQMAKKKALEKMEDMIKRTQEDFDISRPKARGYAPAEFKAAYENVVNMLKPQNDYKSIFKRIIKQSEGFKSNKQSTWDYRSIDAPFDPNRKGKKRAKKPPVALIMDVSGSMSDAEVMGAYGELIGIITEEARRGGVAVRVIQADTVVTMDEFLENPKKKDIAKILKRTASGGTYMEPAIKRALGLGYGYDENGNKISNMAILKKKCYGMRPKTVFVVTDGWIENDFEDIVPKGMKKMREQVELPPDVEIVWIVTGNFSNNPQMKKKEAEQQLAFDYKKYGKQMKVLAVDYKEVAKNLKLGHNGPSI